MVVAATVTLGCRRSEEPSPTTTQVTHSVPLPYFRDVASQAGIDTVLYCGGTDKDHILESVGSGAAMVDLDNDGRLDIYLPNALRWVRILPVLEEAAQLSHRLGV